MDTIIENKPSTIYDIIKETFEEHDKNMVNQSYANCLVKVLKKYHMWPSMRVKSFKNNEHLVLLHNTYYKFDLGHQYKEIYDQCRSVVLDFSLSINSNIVVSYASSIPERILLDTYKTICDPTDKFQEAYDGTMITCYFHDDIWHFGTSSCPNIDDSRFPHPTKSHGYMFNEILMSYYRNQFTDDEIGSNNEEYLSNKLRKLFTDNLNQSLAYEFVLVHHDNKHIIDYTDLYGEGYKYLIHVNTKDRNTLAEVENSNQSLINIGVKYPVCFQNINEAENHIFTAKSYGFIVKSCKNGMKLYKISPNSVNYKESTDPCNPNVWHNILMVYMKNNKEYKICDYIKEYAPNIQLPVDEKNRPIDPTYLIHTMISTLKDVLYNLYIATTTYNSKTNRFKMNKELDSQFPPIIRYHLAQLRYRQQNTCQNKFLQPTDIYYYICHCNTVKNIKLLINLLATSGCYNIDARPALCLSILNSVL